MGLRKILISLPLYRLYLGLENNPELPPKLWNLEKFQALPLYISSATWKNSNTAC